MVIQSRKHEACRTGAVDVHAPGGPTTGFGNRFVRHEAVPESDAAELWELGEQADRFASRDVAEVRLGSLVMEVGHDGSHHPVGIVVRIPEPDSAAHIDARDLGDRYAEEGRQMHDLVLVAQMHARELEVRFAPQSVERGGAVTVNDHSARPNPARRDFR